MSEVPPVPVGPAAALPPDWIVPDWPAPPVVHAFVTTRSGGVSQGCWGAGQQGGMNVGLASGDEPERIARNRELLNRFLPASPRWLALCHGGDVVAAETVKGAGVRADAATAITPGVVCCVTVADCLPVLLADRSGTVVAAAHAGWRGLAAGILQATVMQMRRRAPRPLGEIHAFLGPSIGAAAYEVGEDVLSAMHRALPHAGAAFTESARGKWRADLPALARQALAQVEVSSVYGGHWCTARDPARFYSYRRDRVTGRHAALIWLQPVT
jgi:YfiH family protein